MTYIVRRINSCKLYVYNDVIFVHLAFDRDVTDGHQHLKKYVDNSVVGKHLHTQI